MSDYNLSQDKDNKVKEEIKNNTKEQFINVIENKYNEQRNKQRKSEWEEGEADNIGHNGQYDKNQYQKRVTESIKLDY